MKKYFPMLSAAVATSQMWAMKAFAAVTDVPDVGGLPDGGDGADGVKDIIIKVVKIVLDFVTLLAVIFVIVAGIRLIVSGGDEGEKDTAKKTIIYAVVGLIIVLFARVIVSFAISLTTGN